MTGPVTLMSMLACAYGADLVLGDPRWLPHPVRGMGLAIEWGEKILRKLLAWERIAGLMLVILIVGGCYWLAAWLIAIATQASHAAGFLVSVFILYTCLSTRDLAVESRSVFNALDAGNLELARKRVSRIVGRDTAGLDESEIVRATLETIAESAMDGIISPLFFACVGGAPLAFAYKAINTLDSMIGHRSLRYIHFGFWAAQVDTWANWIPARCSAAIVTVAAWCSGFKAKAAWRAAWRDGSMGTVPNAGIPEAALAGALEVRLGGENRYQGVASHIGFMGDAIRPLKAARIPEAVRLMYAASFTAFLIAMGAYGLRFL